MDIEKISDRMEELEALAGLASRRMRAPSNLEYDPWFMSGEMKQDVWTGTLIAYPAGSQPFGRTIQYQGLTFNVPRKFQGKTGAIVCNHPDFIVKGNIITPGKSARLIPLPLNDGWYVPEKQFGIPSGQPSDSSNPAARHLWRWQDREYCGLLVRSYLRWVVGDWRVVFAGCRPDGRLGVFGVMSSSADDEHARGRNADHDKGKFKMPVHKHEWTRVCKTCGATR